MATGAQTAGGGGLARDAGDAVQRTRRGRGLEPEGQGCQPQGRLRKSLYGPHKACFR